MLKLEISGQCMGWQEFVQGEKNDFPKEESLIKCPKELQINRNFDVFLVFFLMKTSNLLYLCVPRRPRKHIFVSRGGQGNKPVLAFLPLQKRVAQLIAQQIEFLTSNFSWGWKNPQIEKYPAGRFQLHHSASSCGRPRWQGSDNNGLQLWRNCRMS